LDRVDAYDEAPRALARRSEHETAVAGAHVDDDVLILASERLKLIIAERERLLSASDA
jgi:hypothetical protein